MNVALRRTSDRMPKWPQYNTARRRDPSLVRVEAGLASAMTPKPARSAQIEDRQFAILSARLSNQSAAPDERAALIEGRRDVRGESSVGEWRPLTFFERVSAKLCERRFDQEPSPRGGDGPRGARARATSSAFRCLRDGRPADEPRGDG